MKESHSEIYDIAYELTSYLRENSSELFLKDADTQLDEITIYPSAWYNNFFEIIIRDKNDPNKKHEINTAKLEELLLKKLGEGFKTNLINNWNYKIQYIPQPSNDNATTGIFIKFYKIN